MEECCYGEQTAQENPSPCRALSPFFGKSAFEAREQELKDSLYEENRQKQLLLGEQQRIVGELQEWRDKKDPEPECSEAVQRSRRLLTAF